MMRWGLVPPSAKGDVADAGTLMFEATPFRPRRAVAPLGSMEQRVSCRSRVSTFGSALRQDTASRTTCGWSTVSCLELRYFGSVR